MRRHRDPREGGTAGPSRNWEEILLLVRVVRHRHGFPRKAVDVSSLAVFKAKEGALSNPV